MFLLIGLTSSNLAWACHGYKVEVASIKLMPSAASSSSANSYTCAIVGTCTPPPSAAVAAGWSSSRTPTAAVRPTVRDLCGPKYAASAAC